MSSCSCQGAATPRPLRTSISSFCLRATAAACLAATSAAASVLGAGVVRAGCPLLASLRASLRARADAPPLLLLGVSCLPRSGARPWERAIHSRTWMWTRAHTRSHGMATRRGNAEGAVLPRAYRPLPPPSSPSAAPGGLPSPVCTPYTLPGRALKGRTQYDLCG